MLNIGLTGGIGSGKSAASAALSVLGATIIDADRIAREVLEPGTDGLELVVREFGDHLVGEDGALDRAALAVEGGAERGEITAAMLALVEGVLGREADPPSSGREG